MCDELPNEDYDQKSSVFEVIYFLKPQMTIPSKRHKKIGNNKECNQKNNFFEFFLSQYYDLRL